VLLRRASSRLGFWILDFCSDFGFGISDFMKILDAARCSQDCLSLGECMVRLSPRGHQRIEFATEMEVWVGGGEYNVSYALARLGLRAGWVSRLPDNPVAALVRNHARAAGVDLSGVVWVPYDGVGRADRVGLNFTEVGHGVRGSVTLYDRGHSAASRMKPGEVDWKGIFAKGVRWFHTGGIFSALSPSCAEVALEALKAAHEAGAVTSYDLNFRSKLWSSKDAYAATQKLMPYIRVIIGNEEDFIRVLGMKVVGVDSSYRGLDVDGYKRMVERVVRAYPALEAVGTTLREVVSGTVNHWSAILWYEGNFLESRRYENLEIEDRVGGGDGFASGMVYALLKDKSPQQAVDYGAAHGALLQSTRGDTSMVTLAELEHVVGGGSARIQR
jgi:2-dehydro-3-deoxygluconokinase